MRASSQNLTGIVAWCKRVRVVHIRCLCTLSALPFCSGVWGHEVWWMRSFSTNSWYKYLLMNCPHPPTHTIWSKGFDNGIELSLDIGTKLCNNRLNIKLIMKGKYPNVSSKIIQKNKIVLVATKRNHRGRTPYIHVHEFKQRAV